MDLRQALAVINEHLQKEENKMPSPLKYGQGSIIKRTKIGIKGNIYEWHEVRWFDEYGIRHTKTIPTSDREKAKKFLKQFHNKSLKNSHRTIVISFGKYFQDWYDIYRKPKSAPSIHKARQSMINKIPKEIMQKPLSLIKPQELQAYLNTIQAPTQKKSLKDLFVACLKIAFGEGAIKHEIGGLLSVEKHKARERNLLPRSKETEFINSFPEYLRNHVICYIYTGVRLNELLRIEKSDIDYNKKIIRVKVTKSLRAEDRQKGIKYKIVQIPLLPKVEAIKFPLSKTSRSRIEEYFDKCSKKIGIKLTPHDMRHTYISRCNELGIQHSVIQAIAGHADARMTNHYIHNTSDLVEQEFSKIRENYTNHYTNSSEKDNISTK
jgi:integrase/recombinase XerD